MNKIVLLAAAVAIVAAACSSGSSDATGGVATLESTTTQATGDAAAVSPDDEQALLAFAQCMRDNGVDMEDPTVDADGNLRIQPPRNAASEDFDREAAREAFNACANLLEGVALGPFDGDLTELEDTLVEYAACMRDNGYDLPDPDLSDGLRSFGRRGGIFGVEIDPNDPDFIAANDACEHIFTDAGFEGPRLGRGPRSGG